MESSSSFQEISLLLFSINKSLFSSYTKFNLFYFIEIPSTIRHRPNKKNTTIAISSKIKDGLNIIALFPEPS